MCTHKLIDQTGNCTDCAAQHSLVMDDGVHGEDRLAGRREWLGGPEATSTRGKHLTGKAFATRVRRIAGHLNDKISHIRSESRNIVIRADIVSVTTVYYEERKNVPQGLKPSMAA